MIETEIISLENPIPSSPISLILMILDRDGLGDVDFGNQENHLTRKFFVLEDGIRQSSKPADTDTIKTGEM